MHETKPFFSEVKQDLIANGWDNGKAGTLIRMLLLGMNIHTLILHRLQVRIERIPVVGRTLRRIVGYFTTVLSGCEISALAHLSGGVVMPHPRGIVIGKDVVIEKGATIYQNVTVGTRAGEEGASYPVIGQGATIFTGAVIVGGIKIGANATVGANAVVLADVPDGRTAVGVPAHIL